MRFLLCQREDLMKPSELKKIRESIKSKEKILNENEEPKCTSDPAREGWLLNH